MVKERKKEEHKLHDVELKRQENFGKLIDKISPVVEYFTNKLVKHDVPIAKSTIWGFMLILVLILVGSFLLVIWNKLESAGFTLIIGTILGYLLSVDKIFFKKEIE